MLAKHHLERKQPTKFFCSMTKKIKKTAQFCSLVKTTVNDGGEKFDETLEEQGAIEDEICKYYDDL